MSGTFILLVNDERTYFFINIDDLLLSSVINVLHASGLLAYRIHDHSGDERSKHDVQVLAMRCWPNVTTGGCITRTVTENVQKLNKFYVNSDYILSKSNKTNNRTERTICKKTLIQSNKKN